MVAGLLKKKDFFIIIIYFKKGDRWMLGNQI